MVNFQHRRDRALVRFCGELTREATVDLVETIDMLVRVYFYVLIEIQISSLGGASSALEHYLDAHRRWRAAGVRVRTRVVERAASAAALILSLGDERIAEPGASLLYHLFRLPSNAPVTASAAALMFADLTRLDEQCVARLVERAMADAERATTVSVDVEPSDLQVLRLLTADLPSGAKGRARTLRGLARALERAVRRALRANDRATLVEIYRKLCRSELSVSPAVARILRLIDRVGTAQAPSSVAPQAPGLTIPHWAALYPPAGEVPRETLLRHTLALGDSGSGKTCSAILPVLRSLVEAPPGRVGCALVIDPKGEIGPVLERDAAKRLRRIVPSESGVDLMTGPDWRLGADLAHARYLTAAHRIVRRVLSFEPSLPTRVLADHQSPAETTNAEFFDREGTSLLIVVLAFVLMVTDECSPPPEHWCADAEMTGKWMRALLERAHGRAGARGPNALALAAYVLDTAVALGGPTFDPDPDEDFDDPPWRFATVARAAASVWRNGEGETPDVIDRGAAVLAPDGAAPRPVRRRGRIGPRRMRRDCRACARADGVLRLRARRGGVGRDRARLRPRGVARGAWAAAALPALAQRSRHPRRQGGQSTLFRGCPERSRSAARKPRHADCRVRGRRVPSFCDERRGPRRAGLPRHLPVVRGRLCARVSFAREPRARARTARGERRSRSGRALDGVEHRRLEAVLPLDRSAYC